MAYCMKNNWYNVAQLLRGEDLKRLAQSVQNTETFALYESLAQGASEKVKKETSPVSYFTQQKPVNA